MCSNSMVIWMQHNIWIINKYTNIPNYVINTVPKNTTVPKYTL